MKWLLYINMVMLMLCAQGCKAQGEDFSISEINDSVWHVMQGKTYHKNPHIQRSDLRYIRVLHWDYDGKTRRGEMVYNKLIAEDLIDIFRELYTAHYPIERMVLPDNYDADDERQMRDNNTSCFCYRVVANSKTLSKHAMGMAVDLNTLYNPYYRRYPSGKVVIQPTTGKPYCDRSKKFRYKITSDDLACRLFKKHGFTWGGDWKSHKDYQHFEK